MAQVHAPVGLDIGDMSPEEVGFSILAEILMLKNDGTAKSCQEVKKKAHHKK